MRIKTKYNIGDTIIYDDDGLKIATISKGEVVVAGDVKSLELVKK